MPEEDFFTSSQTCQDDNNLSEVLNKDEALI